MAEPNDILDFLDGDNPIPRLNDNNAVSRALLPTSNQKAALGSISSGTGGVGLSTDLRFSTAATGIILRDRTTDTLYRLKVDNGVLGIEAVT